MKMVIKKILMGVFYTTCVLAFFAFIGVLTHYVDGIY